MEDFKIIKEKQNPLFKRKEIEFIIGAEVTPSHAEARKIISEKFSVPEENIRIKKILGKFGSQTFTISTNLYDSEQDKLNTEGKSKKDVVKEKPASETATEQSTETLKEPTQDAVTKEPQSKDTDNKPKESSEPASEKIEPKEEKKE